MQRALPLFDSIHLSGTDAKVFSAVEYGCAHGLNSIEPFQRILSTFHSEEMASREVNLILSDRVGNDFTTVARTIDNIQWLPSTSTRCGPKIFTFMVAESFYRRVVPSQFVDVGFSLATLHHLERYPTVPASVSDGQEAHQQSLLQEQADRDLCRFLCLRAQEFRPGGNLVLSFVGQSLHPETSNYPSLVDACRQAMVQLVKESRLPPGVASAFRVPTYDRTMEDVKASLGAVQALWAVEYLFEEEIVHPAYETLCASDLGKEEASVRYADTVVLWMMAVISGYFLKALQLAGVHDPVAQSGLLDTWSSMTKTVFLQAHMDEKVACTFIYLKLVRI
ncbi:hypothetical protein DV735_g780, partial [Chaetothyriales sp. CBS 134920]